MRSLRKFAWSIARERHLRLRTCGIEVVALRIGVLLHICALACFSQAAPSHRIGVRVVNGAGELYDRLTGQSFTLRGNNFVRFAPQDAGSAGTIIYQSMFNVDRYDANDMEENLRLMQQSGY